MTKPTLESSCMHLTGWVEGIVGYRTWSIRIERTQTRVLYAASTVAHASLCRFIGDAVQIGYERTSRGYYVPVVELVREGGARGIPGVPWFGDD